MAYSNAFDHDVFISYAHVDDQVLPGATDGWVTTLGNALQVLLAQKLGRAEVLTIWRDLSLSGNAPLSPEILSAVQRSATLIVVLSEGYLASEWCAAESNGFLEVAGEATRRIFVVEFTPIERSRRPKMFHDLTGYPFWTRDRFDAEPKTLGVPVPSPAEPEYYKRLNKLAVQLAAELKRTKSR
jgi:hypothetical protein